MMGDGWADGFRPAPMPPMPADATAAERVLIREVANVRQELRETEARLAAAIEVIRAAID